jgi:hypothetical protein
VLALETETWLERVEMYLGRRKQHPFISRRCTDSTSPSQISSPDLDYLHVRRYGKK